MKQMGLADIVNDGLGGDSTIKSKLQVGKFKRTNSTGDKNKYSKL